jgi:hypothetical protein
VGSKPGSSRFHLFSHFHHFTAEPQRLPFSANFLLSLQSEVFVSKIFGPNMTADNEEYRRGVAKITGYIFEAKKKLKN